MKLRSSPLAMSFNRYILKYSVFFIVTLGLAVSFYQLQQNKMRDQDYFQFINHQFQMDVDTFNLLLDADLNYVEYFMDEKVDLLNHHYAKSNKMDFDLTTVADNSGVKLYVLDRLGQLLVSSVSNPNEEALNLVLFSKGVLDKLEENSAGSVEIGVFEDPSTGRLIYGRLVRTVDQKYILLVTYDLEGYYTSVYQSSHENQLPQYERVVGTESEKIALMVGGENKLIRRSKVHEKLLTYTFSTGSQFQTTLRGRLINLEPQSLLQRLGGLGMSAIWLFSGIVIWLWNVNALKKISHLIEKTQVLLNKEILQGSEIKLSDYPYEEMNRFMKSLQEMLFTYENLVIEQQTQNNQLDFDIQQASEKRLSIEQLIQKSRNQIEKQSVALGFQREKIYISVKSLMYAIEIRDSFTRGHSDRVEFYSEKIALRMNISKVQVENVKFGALLHDVGKIGIRGTLLNKSLNVTPEDTEAYQMHPCTGADLFEGIAGMDEVKAIILQHHERMDGMGYPYGLSGETIHPLARIVAVADAYDAMTSNRPYRSSPMSKQEAINELQIHSGAQFDKEVVRVLIDYLISEEQRG